MAAGIPGPEEKGFSLTERITREFSFLNPKP